MGVFIVYVPPTLKYPVLLAGYIENQSQKQNYLRKDLIELQIQDTKNYRKFYQSRVTKRSKKISSIGSYSKSIEKTFAESPHTTEIYHLFRKKIVL